MTRTSISAGHGEIQWRRPGSARAAAQRRWFGGAPGSAERPSFLQLLLPLVALAIGSILAFAVVLAVVVLALTALF
jgi:hypothetical protein